MSRKSLRQQTAYVGQDVYLFRDTIRDNIAFGKVGATEAEIVAAAKAACAHEFIMGFPLGYDTPVGEHGTQLSGGQRQRIAVARALVKNAPIILLDEATAALDSESEKQVQEAIEHLCQNRTTIVIAHRLHTIMHADAILVVEGGEIVERGRHDDLLRRGGRYASFFRLQHRDAGPLDSGADQRNRVKLRSEFPSPTPPRPFHERHILRHSRPAASLASRRRRNQILSGSPHLVRRAQLSRAHPRDGK